MLQDIIDVARIKQHERHDNQVAPGIMRLVQDDETQGIFDQYHQCRDHIGDGLISVGQQFQVCREGLDVHNFLGGRVEKYAR